MLATTSNSTSMNQIGIITHSLIADEDRTQPPAIIVWTASINEHERTSLIVPDDNRGDVGVGDWIMYKSIASDEDVLVVDRYEKLTSSQLLQTRIGIDGRVQVRSRVAFSQLHDRNPNKCWSPDFGQVSLRLQLQPPNQLGAIYEAWLTTNRDHSYQILSKDIEDFWIVSEIGEHTVKDSESILDAPWYSTNTQNRHSFCVSKSSVFKQDISRHSAQRQTAGRSQQTIDDTKPARITYEGLVIEKQRKNAIVWCLALGRCEIPDMLARNARLGIWIRFEVDGRQVVRFEPMNRPLVDTEIKHGIVMVRVQVTKDEKCRQNFANSTVLGRIADDRCSLPPRAAWNKHRMIVYAVPIIGKPNDDGCQWTIHSTEKFVEASDDEEEPDDEEHVSDGDYDDYDEANIDQIPLPIASPVDRNPISVHIPESSTKLAVNNKPAIVTIAASPAYDEPPISTVSCAAANTTSKICSARYALQKCFEDDELRLLIIKNHPELFTNLCAHLEKPNNCCHQSS